MAKIKKISTELQLLDKFLDTSGDAGTSGQVLSSTGTGINWVSGGSLPGGPYLPLAGGTMTGNIIQSGGNIDFSDGRSANFGDGDDLQIYHDGSNSYINDAGTGDLYIRANNLRLQNADGSGQTINTNNGGNVELFHNNSKKFETTSTGVQVTGKISGLTAGTANTDAVNVQQLNDATTGALIFKGTWSAASTTTSTTSAAVSSSTIVVISSSNAGISVGATVTGAALPAGITVTAIAADEITLTISSAQSITSGATLTFTTVGGIPDLSQTARKITGDYYICETAGVATPNGASTTPDEWAVGDWVAFSDLATDAWQKIDNSSVLSGAGTGGSLAAWSGSGTSVTLQDAPATFSGNNTTFAGTVTANGNAILNGPQTIFNPDSNSQAKILSVGTDAIALYASSGDGLYLGGGGTNNLYLDASTNATFAGIANVSGGVKVTGFTTPTGSGAEMIFTSGSSFFQSYDRVNSVYLPVKIDGSTADLQIGGVPKLSINSSGNATFAGSVTTADDITISNTSPEIYLTNTNALKYNWMVAAQENVDQAFEITPSTAAGGSTYSTPALQINGSTSNATFAGLVSGITPTAAANFTTKAYVDGLTPGAGVFLPLAAGSGSPLTGELVINSSGVKVQGAATDQYFIQGFRTGNSGNTFSVYDNGSTAYINSYQQMAFRANQHGGSGGNFAFTGGNVGIGTTAAGRKLDIAGITRTIGFSNTNNYIEGILSANFVNGVADQNYDIQLGNISFWGYIEVEITGTYSNQNSAGKLTKIYAVGVNPAVGSNAGIIYTNDTRVSDSIGTIKDNIALGDFRFDGTDDTGVFAIRVSHIVSTGNGYTIKVRAFTHGSNGSQGASGILTNLNLSSVYTQTALTRQYVYYNENVGIGTTSPLSNLHIKTSVDNSVAQGLVIERSANSDKGYINYNGGGFQFRSTVGDPIVFGETDAEHMRILADGNVGIGTTAPGRTLDVRGDAQILSTSTTGLRIVGGTTSEVYMIFGDADDNSMGGFGYNNDTNELSIDVNNSEAIRIDSSGNVGIGTTGPSQKLHVAGNARVTGAFYDSNNSPGTAGQVLSSTATGTDWIAASGGGGGTVTSVGSGAGLTGGAITSTGSLAVDYAGTDNVILSATDEAGSPIDSGSKIIFSPDDNTVRFANVSDLPFTNNAGTTTASNTQTFTNKSGNISQWTNDSGYTTSAGTVTSVSSTTAGNALDVAVATSTTTPALAFTFAGDSTTYIQGDGDLNDFPVIPVVYTPDVWQLSNPQTISNGTTLYRSNFENTKLISGTTASEKVSGVNNKIKVTQAGTYEISYDATLQTTYSIRQVILGYVEINDGIAQGSGMSNYLRVTGNNQGGVSSVSNTFYCVLAVNDELRFAFEQIGPATFTGMQNITIKDAITGLASAFSIRRIA